MVSFLQSFSHHLKLLAYVPVLEALVRPLGYQSSPRITATLRHNPANTPMAALILLARWYKAWIVAGIVLAAVMVGLAVRIAQQLAVHGLDLRAAQPRGQPVEACARPAGGARPLEVERARGGMRMPWWRVCETTQKAAMADDEVSSE